MKKIGKMKEAVNSKGKIDKLPFGLELSQFVYFIFAIGGTVAITVNIILIKEFDMEFLWSLITAGIFWILFYGTYKIKSWVVIPVLVFSAFASFHGILGILIFHPTTSHLKKNLQGLRC